MRFKRVNYCIDDYGDDDNSNMTTMILGPSLKLTSTEVMISMFKNNGLVSK